MIENKIFLVRHGNDDDGNINHIDGLDGVEPSLSVTGVEQSQLAAKTIVDELARSGYQGKLNVYSSPKKRATDTAEIVTREIGKHGFQYDLLLDDALSHPYYGETKKTCGLSQEEKVKMFHLAWRAFDESWIQKHDLNYQFGTPYGQYDRLRDFFEAPFGESQSDIYSRVYGSLSGIIERANECDGVPIVVTHKTVARDIHGFLANREAGDILQSDYRFGNLLKHGEVLVADLGSSEFCIAAIQSNLQTLKESCNRVSV